MDKQVFDDVIGEVPPSTVDVEAVITRGRRADRLRWATNPAAVAGVAVVVLSGAVAFTMTGGDDSGGVGVGTTASSSTWPPAECPRTDLELPEEAKAHLSAVAKAAVQEQRPDLQLTAKPVGRFDETVNNPGPLEFHRSNDYPRQDMANCHDLMSLVALAKTKGAEGDGSILISIAPDVYDVPDCAHPVFRQTFCEQVTGPNGETIVKRTTEFEGRIQYEVNIDKPDGTEVAVVTQNYFFAIALDGPPPTATTPPLNYDQLIAIGTDPGLTLYP